MYIRSDGNKYVSESGDVLSIDDINEIISESDNPAKGVDMYNQFLSNAKSNLEEGIITEKAYKEMLSVSKKYATKLA